MPRASRGSSLMRIKQRDVYTARYIRNGNSYCIVLPPGVREVMGLVPGDTLAMNFSHGVLWVVRLTTDMIINRDLVSRVFDELFPDKVDAHASK